MRTKRLWGLGMLFLAVAIGGIFMATTEVAPEETQTSHVVVRPVPQVRPVSVGKEVHASRQPKDSSQEIRRRFETSTNYAAFIHDALSRPEEGGRFFAYVAYNKNVPQLCRFR